MKKILVIGIGSRIMMDDAIGIYIVEDLRQLGTNPNITYILGETDVDYCIEDVLDFDFVIIIDAFLSGKQPGEITILPLNELNEESEDSLYSAHGVHLLNMLRCAKRLPDGIIVGIEPHEIIYGFSLSDRLQNCFDRILNEVHRYIGSYTVQYGGK
ncbi:MAG TPA: hydrogenase maturation protease [Clostridia bacterium]|nr:hydrogenase maturation protease [Clostridia bacterium]